MENPHDQFKSNQEQKHVGSFIDAKVRSPSFSLGKPARAPISPCHRMEKERQPFGAQQRQRPLGRIVHRFWTQAPKVLGRRCRDSQRHVHHRACSARPASPRRCTSNSQQTVPSFEEKLVRAGIDRISDGLERQRGALAFAELNQTCGRCLHLRFLRRYFSHTCQHSSYSEAHAKYKTHRHDSIEWRHQVGDERQQFPMGGG